MFRLIVYDTNENNKYMAKNIFEILGNKESVWNIWYMLTEKCNKKHVEIFDLAAILQHPENGINGLSDSSNF